jgi:CRP/FNR family transcriptional regulator, cyclic AMP receptor protein
VIRKKFDHDLAKKIVKSVPLFDNFSDEQLSSLLEKSNVYSYGRDEVIMMAGEEVSQMYVVLKGQIRVVDITADGQERVMAFRHRGDCFGDMGLLDNKTDSATVIANEACKVLLISKSVFDDLFMEDKHTLLQIIDVLCNRLRESWLFHSIIGINDAESKIRATLAHYSKTLGIRNTNGVIINATLSHQSIADRVHITRETVTRVLKKLRSHHEIEMEGRRFKLLPLFFEKYEKSDLFRTLKTDLKSHWDP